jgi:hypothetical protein
MQLGISPAEGFMGRKDWERVCKEFKGSHSMLNFNYSSYCPAILAQEE